MAAPSGTVWGSIVGSYGKIGIYKSLSSTSTTTTVTVQVWFWSKYSVSDTANTLYFDNLSASGSATTSKGAVSISTTVASGSGWSTSNQKQIASYSYSYTRGTSAVTRYLYAKLANIDRVGGTMYASTTFSVPALATYTVSYNANGGSGAPSSQTKYYGKSLTLSSTKPTRTGYTFQGWGTSSSDTSADYAAGATYSANAGITLYAVWKAITYTVSYNANGGSGAPSSQTKTYGVALTLSSTVPTRTNYTFKGWGTSASATTVSYAAGASYTANAAITLYAIWSLTYTKPRITNYTVTRCDSNGTSASDGTYAKVIFNWATDKTISSIKINWKLTTESSYSNSATVTASGTSGSVDTVIGGGALSAEYLYNIQVIVTDSNGNSKAVLILPSENFLIDFLGDGTGIAVGKAATVSDVFDVYKKTIIRGNADASGTAASGQLIIGDPDAYHIAMDNNEIMAKINATTPSNLTINYEGGNVGIGNDNYNVTLNGNVYMSNGKNLFFYNASGESRAIVGMNTSDQMVFGYGSYNNNEGACYYDGKTVNIRSKGGVYITSPNANLSYRGYGVNKIIGTGPKYMTADHTVTLTEAVSAQPNGIVLCWSQYTDGSTVNSNFVYHFIPKQHITSFPGAGIDVALFNSAWTKAADKYVYVSDTTIKGHANNGLTGTGTNGVTYANNFWVLRYVIGV